MKIFETIERAKELSDQGCPKLFVNWQYFHPPHLDHGKPWHGHKHRYNWDEYKHLRDREMFIWKENPNRVKDTEWLAKAQRFWVCWGNKRALIYHYGLLIFKASRSGDEWKPVFWNGYGKLDAQIIYFTLKDVMSLKDYSIVAHRPIRKWCGDHSPLVRSKLTCWNGKKRIDNNFNQIASFSARQKRSFAVNAINRAKEAFDEFMERTNTQEGEQQPQSPLLITISDLINGSDDPISSAYKEVGKNTDKKGIVLHLNISALWRNWSNWVEIAERTIKNISHEADELLNTAPLEGYTCQI